MLWAFFGACTAWILLLQGYQWVTGCEQCTPVTEGPMQLALGLCLVGLVGSRWRARRDAARIHRAVQSQED
ncbi:MAG TPA: hypothetical protein RMG48_21435 [Myxococcales bacterium LLY-WYZ-16_1]|nr:hypothetical protein [Myxococcales bacterium LLY-WYZ-16_1]